MGHWERGGTAVVGKESEGADPEEKESALE